MKSDQEFDDNEIRDAFNYLMQDWVRVYNWKRFWKLTAIALFCLYILT